MNVLLVGEESAGIQTLKALTRGDHRIVAVMASPSKKSLGSSTLWQVAERIGLPIERTYLPAAGILRPGARLDNGI